MTYQGVWNSDSMLELDVKPVYKEIISNTDTEETIGDTILEMASEAYEENKDSMWKWATKSRSPVTNAEEDKMKSGLLTAFKHHYYLKAMNNLEEGLAEAIEEVLVEDIGRELDEETKMYIKTSLEDIGPEDVMVDIMKNIKENIQKRE